MRCSGANYTTYFVPCSFVITRAAVPLRVRVSMPRSAGHSSAQSGASNKTAAAYSGFASEHRQRLWQATRLSLLLLAVHFGASQPLNSVAHHARGSASPRGQVSGTSGQPDHSAADGRLEVKAIVGVFTGIGRKYFNRRQAVRIAWVPGSEDSIRQLQTQRGVVVRFVLGFSLVEEEERLLAREEKLYGNMIRLDVKEKYHNLVLKMRRYMQWAEKMYDFKYILKVDDDVYHNPHRLSWVVEEWENEGADYLGCFLTDVKTDKPISSKWFEPNSALLGSTFFSYPAGPTYAISQEAVHRVNSVPDGWLRFFGCGDDCSVASWMLMLNVTYRDDVRLCAMTCSSSSITVRDGPGLLDPLAQLPQLHQQPECHGQNKPGPAPPDNRGRKQPDFSNTNCYALVGHSDTDFERCLERAKASSKALEAPSGHHNKRTVVTRSRRQAKRAMI